MIHRAFAAIGKATALRLRAVCMACQGNPAVKLPAAEL